MKKLSLRIIILFACINPIGIKAQITTRAIVAKVKYLPASLDAYYVVTNTPDKVETRVLELKYTAREVLLDVREIIDSTHTSIEKDQAYLVFRDQLSVQEVESLIATLKTLSRQVADAKYTKVHQHEVIYSIAPHLSVKRIQHKNYLYFSLELYKTRIEMRKNWMQEFIQSLEDGLEQLKAWQE